jgi:hypothetical protein
VASPYKYALGAAQVCGKEEPLKVALGPSLVNLNQFISWFIVANFYNILISSSEVIENLFWRKGVTVTVGINNYYQNDINI